MTRDSLVSVLLVFQLLGACIIYAETDPCHNYTAISDVTLQSSVYSVGWYRSVSSQHGLLADSCPQEVTCSSPGGVIWINDTLLSENAGSAMICLSTQEGCCSEANYIQFELCEGYIVYQLVPLPNQAVYCFNNSKSMPIQTIEPKSVSQPVKSSNDTTQHPSSVTNAMVVLKSSRISVQTTPQSTKPEAPSYLSTIRALTTKRKSTKSSEVVVEIYEEGIENRTIIVIAVVVVVSVLSVLLGVWCVMRAKKRKSLEITKTGGLGMYSP